MNGVSLGSESGLGGPGVELHFVMEKRISDFPTDVLVHVLTNGEPGRIAGFKAGVRCAALDWSRSSCRKS